MKKFSSGFTLIELLVVIAIIGILSSVVLASLSTARSKGNDAKVQESMSSLRNEAEIFYNTNSGYSTSTTPLATTNCAGLVNTGASGFLTDVPSNASSTLSSIIAAAPNCNAEVAPTYWAVQVNLPSGSSYWCVDSSGKAEKTVGVALTSTLCP